MISEPDSGLSGAIEIEYYTPGGEGQEGSHPYMRVIEIMAVGIRMLWHHIAGFCS